MGVVNQRSISADSPPSSAAPRTEREHDETHDCAPANTNRQCDAVQLAVYVHRCV